MAVKQLGRWKTSVRGTAWRLRPLAGHGQCTARSRRRACAFEKASVEPSSRFDRRPLDLTDAQAGHMLVVDQDRSRGLRATRLALRRRAGLADVRNHESIRDGAFRMAHETRPRAEDTR
jgi:hypothetical protein